MKSPKTNFAEILARTALPAVLCSGLMLVLSCEVGEVRDEDGSSPAGEVQAQAAAPASSQEADQVLQLMLAEKALEETAREVKAPAAPSPEAAPAGEKKKGEEIPSLLGDSPAAPPSPVLKGERPGEDELQAALKELAQALGKKEPVPAAAPADQPAAATRGPEAAPAPAAQPPAPQPAAAAPQASAPAAAPAAAAAPAPAPPAAAVPAQAAAAPAAQQPPQPARPAGKTVLYSFFHKTANDFLPFLKGAFPDLLTAGNVALVDGKPKSIIFIGDDAMLQKLTALANDFDDLELKLERVTIRPKYIDLGVLLESVNMAGLANVWNRVNETITVQEQQGQNLKTLSTHQRSVYSKGGLAQGQAAPLSVPPKVPYIFEMPWTDPFTMPRQSTGKGETDQLTVDFRNTSSTERRGVMVAIGTAEDVERITAFVDSIDRPARQIMIEVQLIELDANSLQDLGIDSIQFGQRHSIANFAGPFPGESIVQPGLDSSLRRPGVTVPAVVSEGISYMFDDTSVDISGRFLTTIHALVRKGDAIVRARPKILTLDDRPSILHIGEEVPTFESTAVAKELTGGNFTETINKVTTQYVGFTLNMRPRVSGDTDEDVAIQLEVVFNQLQGRQRVFEQDLLGVPITARRRFVGQPRVKNHRPIILGGLIQEEESESSAKVPWIGEIPYVGWLFGRTQTEKRRMEVILIVTPHILSDKGVDRVATPKESMHFDTFDSVLFNDRHIIKGRDVWGIDPVTKQPAMVKGEVFTENEVVDLTLLNIVKQRQLVSKLGILDEYMAEEAQKLNWLQRRYPERSVYYWSEEEKEIYFKAAAIVIENIKELNPDLTYDDVVTPRREIVLPTTPYRMTLSYDKYKTLKEFGTPVLRGERVELSEAAIALLRDVGMQRTVRQFADYVQRNNIHAEDHGELRAELQRLYRQLQPESDAVETDDYVKFYEELARARIEFVTIATFFQENLNDRYRAGGRPNIGTFEMDLRNFLKTTVTITQRARRLKELETKWSALTTEDEGAGSGAEKAME
ncbi:MAG: hypothetical protein HY717_12820 [Planctomycetes bacterium]|nr:hypothetical protein [Planctomycetota bacterium]